MSKTMLSLLAGILVAWLALGLITKNFNGEYLLTLLFGVFIGYGVKKKELEE